MEQNMERFKNRLKRIQVKIQDKVEDIQDQIQNKYERSKLSDFISHLSEDRSSLDGESIEDKDKRTDGDDTSTDSSKTVNEGSSRVNSLPTVVIDGPSDDMNKEICDNFITLERNSALYSKRSLSTSNLSSERSFNNNNLGESCASCMTSDDESLPMRPRQRSGSLPPLDLPTPLNACSDLIEKLGNKFPGLKSKGDKIQRYLMKSTRLSDVNKRLKAQIWSSVVTIVLVEAKNLPAMDSDTRTSDPYCKFRLGNEKYKSKVVYKSLHPSWLEQFDLHLYDDQEQILEVTVWDKDKQAKDDFIGKPVKVRKRKTHNIWQDLEDGNGQIFLLLTISGTTQSETITDLGTYRENPRDRENIEQRYAWYRLNEHSGGVGWLCVKVFGAKGLAAADLGGKSDPFCVLELGNARLQTHTEYKTLTPNWMKIFTFTVKDISSILEITVYDEDNDHKVEFLGKLGIPLLGIRNGEKRWYALKDKKMRARAKGNYPQIQLEMSVIWNPVKGAIRIINPKEPKYMHQEAKFKRQLFIRNVMRLKAIIMWFIEVGKIL
ncbi:hypothetical protein ACJJTC_004211, partial [Scirpophaga incertulas]